jgi:hypothetical protein
MDNQHGQPAIATPRRSGRARVGLALGGVIVLVLAGAIWTALQPRTANHFGYALPGKDGLPTYIYANGRRYHSAQVCAGADWCQQERARQGIPRCYTQADLQGRLRLWPLVHVGDMFTLFGAPRAILARAGDQGLRLAFTIADAPGCYVTYTLEGGP